MELGIVPTPQETLTFSIIVPTLHRPDDLMRMLDSCAKQTRPAEEIWIIDQSEDARTRELVDSRRQTLADAGTRLEYRHRTIKSGAQARNAGMDLATGDVFGFLDDDVILEPDYFESIARHLAAHPEWAGIAGNASVDRPEWRTAKWKMRLALWKLFLVEGAPGRATASGFGHPVFDRMIDKPVRVDFLPGCNMWLRRSAAGAERFDTWFEGYSFREDAEFSYRVAKRGELWMVPDAHLEHRYSTSSRQTPEALKKMEMRNYAYVFRKHFPQTPFRKFLMAYSMAGLLTADFLECLSGRNETKWRKFRAGVDAVRAEIFGGKRR